MNLENDHQKSRLLIAAAVGLCTLVLGVTAEVGGRTGQACQKPYFGQNPPGTTPQVFAPGIVSTSAHEFAPSFTPDGKEFYFTRRGETQGSPTLIMVSKCIDGVWTEPEAAPFNEKSSARQGGLSFEPQVTPDGRRLYFSSDRPLPGQGPGGPPLLNIWYVEREGDGWGVPQYPGPPFNPMKTMYVSMTNAGTIYTMDISGGLNGNCIAMAKRIDGAYQSLEKLGPPINVGTGNMYPYIAPDESYLIFSRQPEAGPVVMPRGAKLQSRKESVLMVSFRNSDGTWGEPRAIDLGPLAGGGTGVISPDGRYLFFSGGEQGKGDIYWMEAAFLKR